MRNVQKKRVNDYNYTFLTIGTLCWTLIFTGWTFWFGIFSSLNYFDYCLELQLNCTCQYFRYDLCATVLNGVLYTIGGKAQRFDLRTEKWSVIDKECLDRKFYMGCCSANGRMYFLGQRRASITSDIPNFALFDPYLDVCQVVDINLPCPLPIRGCVTMRRYDVWPWRSTIQ